MRRMVVPPAVAALFFVALPLGVAAQTTPQSDVELPDAYQAAPAHVSVVDGRATLEREGRAEANPLNAPLLSGDRLRTADGRVEVLFGDGVSTLHLDSGTTVDVESDDLLRLINGRLRLNIATAGRVNYRVDSPAGSVRISQPGEYRISMLHGDTETQLELAVIRGAADIFTEQGSTSLTAGQRGYSSAGLAPSYAYAFNSANWDAFDQWSESQRSARLGVTSQSTQYLPADIQTYAPTFDTYGDWQYNTSYGYVWYPRVVAGWRPYYYGRWASYPRYGWTWIGTERWAWPTHHYGRWGFSAGAWFWIPGSIWAPAYVSWGYAPGYVSWCPLGFNNSSVFSLSVGFGWGGGYYSPWYGWTAMPYGYFGHGWVHEHAAHWEHTARGQYPNFHARPGPPTVVGQRAAVSARPVIGPGASRGIAVVRGSNAASAIAPNVRSAPAVTARQAPGASVRPTPGTTVPRFVNRGDQIVRSQTARPRPPVVGTAPGRTAGIDAQRGVQPYTATSPAAPAVPRTSVGPQSGFSGRTVPVRPGIPAGGGGPYAVERAAPGTYAPSYGGGPRGVASPYNVPRGYYNAAPRTMPVAPRGMEAPGQGYGRPGPGFSSRPMQQGPPPAQAMPRFGSPGGGGRPAGAAPAGRPGPSSGGNSGGGHAAPRGGRGGR